MPHLSQIALGKGWDAQDEDGAIFFHYRVSDAVELIVDAFLDEDSEVGYDHFRLRVRREDLNDDELTQEIDHRLDTYEALSYLKTDATEVAKEFQHDIDNLEFPPMVYAELSSVETMFGDTP